MLQSEPSLGSGMMESKQLPAAHRFVVKTFSSVSLLPTFLVFLVQSQATEQRKGMMQTLILHASGLFAFELKLW